MTNTIFPEIHTANIAATSIEPGMTTIEPTVNTGTGVKSLAYQDEDGTVRRVLTTESMTDTNATALTDGGETALHSHAGGSGGGEANTTSNAGTGVGIALTKVGTDLPIASLTSAGGTVDISLDGNNLNLETIGDTGYYETADSKAVYVIDGLVNAISLLFDGWMEKSGITDWDSALSPIITKETDGDTGQVLRIAVNVSGNPSATQTCLEVGKTYRLTGRARSDGSAMPRLSTSTGFWSGTSATEWQYFDETFVAGLTILYLKCISSVSGQYAEFDNMTLREV